MPMQGRLPALFALNSPAGCMTMTDPFVLAASHANRAGTARLLIGAGVDLNLADTDGVTPLRHARQCAYTEIATILEKAGE